MKSRRFLRYSLRTALLVVLVLSVWMGWQANRAARQRGAVAALGEFDAIVMYDFQEFGFPNSSSRVEGFMANGGFEQHYSRTPTDPQWLVDLLGVDALHRVVSVWIKDESFDDSDMARLAALPHLKRVYLFGTNITDRGLAHLQEHNDLEILELDRTKVTDAGLAHLRGLDKLEFLGANGTGVTREGARGLMDTLPRLGAIYFGDGDALHELVQR